MGMADQSYSFSPDRPTDYPLGHTSSLAALLRGPTPLGAFV
jgi:hypothetical protein